ncbi:MAG TPA: hypothetical protein VK895_12785 [Jiangellaceae bacterium]|nr:hypothetical protein [Jiangellaceae bacterium]
MLRTSTARWEDTDWEQIVVLYDMLLRLAPSPVTGPHRAIALRYAAGPADAMSELDELSDALDRYHLFHAAPCGPAARDGPPRAGPRRRPASP